MAAVPPGSPSRATSYSPSAFSIPNGPEDNQLIHSLAHLLLIENFEDQRHLLDSTPSLSTLPEFLSCTNADQVRAAALQALSHLATDTVNRALPPGLRERIGLRHLATSPTHYGDGPSMSPLPSSRYSFDRFSTDN